MLSVLEKTGEKLDSEEWLERVSHWQVGAMKLDEMRTCRAFSADGNFLNCCCMEIGVPVVCGVQRAHKTGVASRGREREKGPGFGKWIKTGGGGGVPVDAVIGLVTGGEA